jgi:CBS domain-containing protein
VLTPCSTVLAAMHLMVKADIRNVPVVRRRAARPLSDSPSIGFPINRIPYQSDSLSIGFPSTFGQTWLLGAPAPRLPSSNPAQPFETPNPRGHQPAHDPQPTPNRRTSNRQVDANAMVGLLTIKDVVKALLDDKKQEIKGLKEVI